MSDKYESYRAALLAGGVSEHDIDRAIRDMKLEDSFVQAGFCPKCAAEITRTLDPRQAGPTKVAGKWFNYRCTRKCGWFADRCEPVGEN